VLAIPLGFTVREDRRGQLLLLLRAARVAQDLSGIRSDLRGRAFVLTHDLVPLRLRFRVASLILGFSSPGIGGESYGERDRASVSRSRTAAGASLTSWWRGHIALRGLGSDGRVPRLCSRLLRDDDGEAVDDSASKRTAVASKTAPTNLCRPSSNRTPPATNWWRSLISGVRTLSQGRDFRMIGNVA
jgi:hypothetical protein